MQASVSRHTVDLLHGSIFKSILVFSIPIIISTLFQQLYNTIDVMIVGNSLGEAALAAIGASTPIFDLLIGFAIGMGNGLSVVTARYFGTGDRQQLRRSVAAALLIAAGLAILLTIAARLGELPLLRLLNTPEEILEEANAYISTILLFAAVSIAYNLCSSILRSVGDSLAPMLFLAFSSLLNIGLDLLLIRGAGMGILGAAIATVIAQSISVVLSLMYIWRKHPQLLPKREDFQWDRRLYIGMLTQGLSMGMMSTIVNIGSLILQYGINSMGYLIIAGHTAARRIFSFCNIPFISIGHAMATFASQNYGAGQYDRIRRAIREIAVMEFVLNMIILTLMYLFVPQLAAWLTGSQDPEVIGNCSRYVRFFCPFFTILGSLFALRNALQGLDEKMLPLISSIIEMIAKILFTVLLVPIWAYDAVIVCEPIIWVLMTLQLMFAFYTHPKIRRPKRKKAAQ